MVYPLDNKGLVNDGNTLLYLFKAHLVKASHHSSTISKIKKCIPGKMKCGLAFQHLPESIHMVRRYEIIGEECKTNIVKLIMTAKWGNG